MPYDYRFLTPALEKFLKNDRTELNSKGRAIYNFRIRKGLKQGLEDLVFVLERLDKKQFDKISKETQTLIVKLLVTFAERYVEPINVEYPLGRIKEYKALKYFTSEKEGDVLMNINRSAFERISGKRKLKENANKTKVVWKQISEKKEKK